VRYYAVYFRSRITLYKKQAKTTPHCFKNNFDAVFLRAVKLRQKRQVYVHVNMYSVGRKNLPVCI